MSDYHEYRWLYDENGEPEEVLAVVEHAVRAIYDGNGRMLASFSGETVDHLMEVALTNPHEIPAGSGWQRDGVSMGHDGAKKWRWRRDWISIAMPLESKKDNGRL